MMNSACAVSLSSCTPAVPEPSTASAESVAAGPKKATVCVSLRARVSGMPMRFTSVSQAKPA
eukprot:1832771-Prymnesium_polylepis.1